MDNNVEQYKNPLEDFYVCPYGYHFTLNGKNLGRILRGIKATDGINFEKDE